MYYPKSIQTELYLSEQTYKEASSKVGSKNIKTFLEKLAQSRNRFRKQLFVEKKAEKGKELNNNLKIVPGMGTNSTQNILIRCLKEEEKLIKEYQKALNTNRLDKNHYQVLSLQLNNAVKAFNQLRALKLSGSYS